MINFIISEKNVKIKDIYEFIILNFIGVREEKFKIFDYNNYHKKTTGNIYIISHNKIKKALRIAEKIRNNNDWDSLIIIISDLNNIKPNDLINRLLVLDYIDINSDINDTLKASLFTAYRILTRHKTYNFYMNQEIVKIPYDDILYIEKSNNQNYCTIHTKDNAYVTKNTINNLESALDPAYFMKTHRSCIVNLHNIEHYNSSDNVLYFNYNKETDLIAREKRQILKSKLINEKVKK